MNRRELSEYHSELTGILRSEPDRSKWKEFLSYERTTEPYKTAQKQARLRNLIKPILLEVGDLPNEDRTEELVDVMLNRAFERIAVQEKEAFWSNALNEYNNFPKQTSREKKHAKNLITQSASELLKNPQDINIAEAAWRRHEEGQNHTEESKDSFPNLVKRECLALIKDKWQGVKPEQLAQLVRISADNDDPSQDDAKKMLTNYFKGPKSRNQRIDAYYNFVSGVLDLAEEDEAFREGMKIALHATDILPKDPSLVEQTCLLSLPYGEVESVFKKLLIARSVVSRVRFIGSWDFDKYYEDRANFIITDRVAIEEGNKREGNVIRKIGENETRKMHERMKDTMGFIAGGSIEDLSEERKQSLIKVWPFNLVLDETDPLNQKFKRILAENRSNSGESIELGLV